MKGSDALAAVSARLAAAGFQPVSGRFKVASVTFDFPAVFTGKPERGSDLVVLVDTTDEDSVGDRGVRARQKLEALTMALDVADWRVVVTAILIGPPLPSETVEEMTRTCRVLSVSQATLDRSGDAPPLDDRLRVLLPLEAGLGDDALIADPLGQVERQMQGTGDARLAEQLIAASLRGEDEVRRVLSRAIEAAVAPGLASA
jgi:hypothetical protein